jgi:myo-inositol 2-dehydrogenase/D-chiro-inositol 1-dehydrogenase
VVATGDGGKLECTVPGGELVIGTRKYRDHRALQVPPDPRVEHAGFHHGASYIEHLEFIEAIHSGGEPTVTVQDGLRSVALGVAAHRSIEEGRPITMEELGVTD